MIILLSNWLPPWTTVEEHYSRDILQKKIKKMGRSFLEIGHSLKSIISSFRLVYFGCFVFAVK